jgi:hypothetical protein
MQQHLECWEHLCLTIKFKIASLKITHFV